jgi:hypothetical protein
MVVTSSVPNQFGVPLFERLLTRPHNYLGRLLLELSSAISLACDGAALTYGTQTFAKM